MVMIRRTSRLNIRCKRPLRKQALTDRHIGVKTHCDAGTWMTSLPRPSYAPCPPSPVVLPGHLFTSLQDVCLQLDA